MQVNQTWIFAHFEKRIQENKILPVAYDCVFVAFAEVSWARRYRCHSASDRDPGPAPAVYCCPYCPACPSCRRTWARRAGPSPGQTCWWHLQTFINKLSTSHLKYIKKNKNTNATINIHSLQKRNTSRSKMYNMYCKSHQMIKLHAQIVT